MASADGHWERAQHLELVPPDSTPLTSRSEEYLVAQELKLKAKVDESTAGASSSASSWKGYGKDKGGSKGGYHWPSQWSNPWSSWSPPWPPFGGKGKGQKGTDDGKGRSNGKGKNRCRGKGTQDDNTGKHNKGKGKGWEEQHFGSHIYEEIDHTGFIPPTRQRGSPW